MSGKYRIIRVGNVFQVQESFSFLWMTFWKDTVAAVPYSFGLRFERVYFGNRDKAEAFIDSKVLFPDLVVYKGFSLRRCYSPGYSLDRMAPLYYHRLKSKRVGISGRLIEYYPFSLSMWKAMIDEHYRQNEVDAIREVVKVFDKSTGKRVG